MRNKWNGNLRYIEVCSGPGRCSNRQGLEQDGTALAVVKHDAFKYLQKALFIDYNNKDVDEKTRKVSVARTIAKIIAGTLTGFAIRYGCIKGIKALSQIPAKGVPKWKTIFTPKGIKDNTTEAFAQYRNAMGTVVALVIMMFTNFLIDAPLTKFLTNFFVKKQGGEK